MSEPFSVPAELPILPSRETVVFPGMLVPLAVRNERWIKAIDSVAPSHKTIGFFYQPEAVDPLTQESLPSMGCAASIVRMLRLPDGSVQVLLQGVSRIRPTDLLQTEPFPTGGVQALDDQVVDSMEIEGLVHNLRSQFTTLVNESPSMPDELAVAIANIDEPGRIADFVAANVDLPLPEKQALLEQLDVAERLRQVTMMVNRELEVVEIGSRIQSQIRDQMDKSQREYYLREQLKAIQRELGEADPNESAATDLRERLDQANLPEEAHKEAERELERLTSMSPMAPEASVIRTYLEWMAEVPWSVSTEDNLDLAHAEQVLNEDHYDLEKVKDRIL